jgi:hypothetical protein
MLISVVRADRQRGEKESRRERARILVNASLTSRFSETKIYRVPADFADLALGRQACRIAGMVKSRVFDDQHEIL